MGRIVFDVHTMLFGMVFALLGGQVISLGLFAKVYSYAERFSPKQKSLERWLRQVKLEHGLILGFALASIGAGGSVWLLTQWIRSGLGRFDELRLVIFFSLWFLP